MIELHRRFTVVTSPDVLSLDGIEHIQQFIRIQRIVDGDQWKILNPTYPHWWLPELPEDWNWAWVLTTGDNQGTFPRRIARYYFKNHKLKCPKGFLAQIGNIARAHSHGGASESFDFDNDFDWEDGDFADGGSCYWWNGQAGIEALRHNGFMAIRFYESDDSDTGKARAWLYQLRDNLYILFNGYGYSTLTIAGIFARFMNLRYKRIALSNYDNTAGVLYINNDTGYIIGEIDAIERYDSYDFEIDVDEFDICVHCGRHMHEDDVYFSPYGEPYCEDCFDRFFRSCDYCSDTFNYDDLTYVESVGQDVCSRCLDRNFSCCDGCNKYFEPNEMHQHADKLFCWDCLNDTTSPPDWAE